MEVLQIRGPFILALGSAPAGETGPGHERTASRHPHGPVTGDDWLLLPASLHGDQGTHHELGIGLLRNEQWWGWGNSL